jgi:hypothetical protein
MSVNANVTVPLGSGGLVRTGVGSGVALTWTVFALGGFATASCLALDAEGDLSKSIFGVA